MEDKKTYIGWIFKEAENSSNRYIEAEKFIVKLAEMNFIKRAFYRKKIYKFLKERNKYNF